MVINQLPGTRAATRQEPEAQARDLRLLSNLLLLRPRHTARLRAAPVPLAPIISVSPSLSLQVTFSEALSELGIFPSLCLPVSLIPSLPRLPPPLPPSIPQYPLQTATGQRLQSHSSY